MAEAEAEARGAPAGAEPEGPGPAPEQDGAPAAPAPEPEPERDGDGSPDAPGPEAADTAAEPPAEPQQATAEAAPAPGSPPAAAEEAPPPAEAEAAPTIVEPEPEPEPEPGADQPAAEGESPAEEPAVQEVPSAAWLLAEAPAGAASGPPVGADQGRRISHSLWELEQRSYSCSSLGSALGLDGEEEAEAEARRLERLAEEQRQRAELADQYRQLLAERARRRHHSARLQGQLGALLGKGKSTERARAEPGPGAGAGAGAGPEPRVSDQEQRYGRYLAALEELRGQQAGELAGAREQQGALRRSGEERRALAGGQWRAYQAAVRDVAVYTMGRRLGGRQAAVQAVEQIQARERAKEKELTEARLENIKLKRRIQKLEASLKAQEELAEGLHLIDFEQLKIENQTYNEKIEERNEELLKLRRKITNTVQVLTQVKEKLQFVEAQNQGQKVQLMAIEALVAQKREILTKTKQARDKLRMDNQKLQQKCGLLGNTLLLRDFEDKVATNELLNERLEKLKRRHAGLSLTCKGVKKKIQGAKSFLPL